MAPSLNRVALFAAAVVLALASAPSVIAWGNVGHQVVGAIADALLTPTAASAVSVILNGSTLEQVATWADSIKHFKEFDWTPPLHYIDTVDFACRYTYSGDCYDHEVGPSSAGACVTGAIWNFTQKITPAEFLNYTYYLEHPLKPKPVNNTVIDAMKFVVHFMGDVHQPLHVGFSSDRGGNLIEVEFYGYRRNLHSVWDEWIIDRILKQNFDNDQSKWTSSLVDRVKTGDFSRLIPAWTTCKTGEVSCVDTYAVESMQFACADAYVCQPDGPKPCPSQAVTNDTQLGDDYYNQSSIIVDLRIAQGGVRLATLLNNLFV